MKSLLSFAKRHSTYLPGVFVFGISLLIQTILLTDYYLHSPFYSGLICDSKVYYQWATDILGGNWFGKEVFHQAPLYPYFIAALWLIAGKSYLAIYISQALLMAFSALLVFLISKNYFNNRAGLAAGLLCAFYGALNFYALKVLPDTLGVALHLCLAFLLMKADSPRKLLLTGCVCGLLIIGRPHVLLLLPMVLLWLIFSPEKKSPWPEHIASGLKRFGFFILPVVILISMVALRNYMIEPDLVLVSSNGGENFFMGNNSKADGIYCRLDGVSPDIEYQKTDVKKAAETATRQTLTSARVSRWWLSQGLIFIRDNSTKYLRLEALKFKRMFSGTEYTNMYFLWFERAGFTKTLFIPAVNFYMVLPLAFIGAFLCAGAWRKYGLLYIMILLGILNMLIFYVDERYRLPLIPFLIVLGAGGVYRLVEITKTAPFLMIHEICLSALVASAIATTVYLYRTEPERLDLAPQLYCNLGEVYYTKGEYRQALNMFYKSSRMAANNWTSAIGAAKTLFAMGNKDMAVNLYRQAFPNSDKELQSSCMRDHDLDGLREYMAVQAGNREKRD